MVEISLPGWMSCSNTPQMIHESDTAGLTSPAMRPLQPHLGVGLVPPVARDAPVLPHPAADIPAPDQQGSDGQASARSAARSSSVRQPVPPDGMDPRPPH